MSSSFFFSQNIWLFFISHPCAKRENREVSYESYHTCIVSRNTSNMPLRDLYCTQQKLKWILAIDCRNYPALHCSLYQRLATSYSFDGIAAVSVVSWTLSSAVMLWKLSVLLDCGTGSKVRWRKHYWMLGRWWGNLCRTRLVLLP